jgi:phosphohistidine phosphatase
MAVDDTVDPARPLSDEGRKEVERMAKFLSGARIKVPLVWHSGKARAEQTAEIYAKAVGAAHEVHDGMKPKDDPDKLQKAIRKNGPDLMLVGHLPYMSKMAGLLLAGKESADIIQFRYAGVVCLERDEDGDWRLLWMVTPDIVL